MKNIKNWYESEFTTDELGKEINPNATFEELKDNLPNVYDYLDLEDSIVRERVFTELAEIMNVHNDVIYHKWLNG
jgi:molybdopterin converting factor small subunit